MDEPVRALLETFARFDSDGCQESGGICLAKLIVPVAVTAYAVNQ